MSETSDSRTTLTPVIGIDRQKCVNCHACISACPVKFCNDGSGDSVVLDSNMCIGCGTCLAACTHGARYYVDDFAAFMEDLANGVRMVAITAPSAAANFPGQYRNLNGWLRSLGVEAVFDVSFGAELSVRSYVEYIRDNHPEVIIAQPCPVIVTFIEIYCPELLPYLAPVDSPMGHCMKMIRRERPEYGDHRIVAISPCIAKKREFLETGLGDYNVGYVSISKYLRENGLSLADFAPADFEGPDPERAVLFPSPGGLRRSIARWLPEYAEETREIGGVETLYDYLRKLSEAIREHRAPRLVDCLNCEMGCNGGPLTLAKDLPVDVVEYWIEQRNREMQALYGAGENREEAVRRIEQTVECHWARDAFSRHYHDLRTNNLMRQPSDAERDEIFRRMHKYSERDIYNCTSCGYMACRDMAAAIFNGKNRPENCHFYLANEAAVSHEKILQREYRFRTIIETSLEGFVQVNNDLVIEMVNQAVCRMLDCKPDEMVGRRLHELVAPDHQEILDEQIGLREELVHSTYEIDLMRRNGSRVKTLFSASPLLDRENHKIGAFALVTDITKMKQAEEWLRRSRDELEHRVEERTQELALSNTSLRSEVERRRAMEEALRESETRLQAIIHGCPIPQFVIDRDHRVISWNRPIEEYSGIRAEEVLGTKDHWRAFYTHERPCLADLLLDGAYEMVSHWYAGKFAPSKLVEGAYEATDFFPHMGSDGRWLYFTAARIHDVHGNVIGAIETLEDITERKRAEEDRLELERQVQHAQKLESLGVLAGGIAHDFNNLLAGILGNAELALLDLPVNSGARQSVELIVTTAQRAADLAKQMLAYSGKGRFVITQLNLSDAVKEMAHLLGVSVSKKAAFKYELADDLPPVQADATQIRQVIMNLITNASEAIGEGQGVITISTGVAQCDAAYLASTRLRGQHLEEGTYVFVEVSDNGCGMDESMQEKIFDPFFSTKFTGRGLGLSAVMGIVKGHRGTIEVRSERGRGTSFRVLLPASKATGDVVSDQQPVRREEKVDGTVLVVDDEAGVRAVTKQLLERKGFHCLAAGNGAIAIEIFRKSAGEISCVILDLTMPDMDGFEVLTELQRIRPDVRVVMSSGYSEQELARRFRDRGVAGFIQKPFRLDALMSAVHEALAPARRSA